MVEEKAHIVERSDGTFIVVDEEGSFYSLNKTIEEAQTSLAKYLHSSGLFIGCVNCDV